jgi:hypothetical protein
MAQVSILHKTEFNILGIRIRVPRVKFPQITENSLYLPSPFRNFLLTGIYIVLFYLVSGGIYIQIRDPPALGVDEEGKITWLVINLGEAFLIESFIACVCIFNAGLGFILLIEAQKNAYDYGYSIKLIIGGLFLIGFCFSLLQWMIWYKNPLNHKDGRL